MSQTVTIQFSDGTNKKYSVHESRLSPLIDFLKAVKQDDFGGTWNDSDSAELSKIVPSGIRVVLESGKKYLLSQTRRDVLETYLSGVKLKPWNKSWGVNETALFAGFSDQIIKDGT